MNIVFIITSYWAYGELSIACEFALRIKQMGGTPYFVIPPSHRKSMEFNHFPFITLIPRNRVVNILLLKDIEIRLKPEMVILADFLNYNFCEQHYGLLPEDLTIFSGKLGTFDDFDWTITGNRMDTYGFRSKKYGDIDIRNYGFGLCPCPVVNPLNGAREHTYHYKLIDKKIRYHIERTNQYKKELGLPTNRKLILFTSALWQDQYKKYPDVMDFVEVNQRIFWHMMEELSKDYTILCIGNESYYNKESNHILFLNSLPPQVFDQYLLACDLYLSRNLISTSLARAVVSGIPSVCIQNSYSFHKIGKEETSYLDFIPDDVVFDSLSQLKRSYKYRMFPVGWHYFLEVLCKGNPYMDSFYQVEQYKVKESLDQIHFLLNSGNAVDELRNNTESYNQLLDHLPSVESIILHIIQGVNA